MKLKEHTACFTGHRKIPSEQLDIIALRLKNVIIELIKSGYIRFCVGGALGFDTLAANTVLSLKEDYPEINLILVLPCLSQSDKWDSADKETYEFIKERADEVIYASHERIRGCMHIRNRYLVDNSSACICYLTEKNGGTVYTVKYAKKKNLPVINIADE